jgi:uncharacterized protein (DUF2236 family)
MGDFVDRHSIVRTIWGSTDSVLLIFAGSAAEFALNRAVDWLFFTGKIPRDPVGRLFTTVRYAQQIIFVSEEQARQTLGRINAVHGAVERQRGQSIPPWAYRDVLYMLIDYSERAHQLLYRPLSPSQREDLYAVFLRVGERLNLTELPATYEGWRVDRQRHLRRDLAYSQYTARLYRQYRRHLGAWRYQVLLEVQALLAPGEVRHLLGLRPNPLLSGLARTFAAVDYLGLQSVIHGLLIPQEYWGEVRDLGRGAASTHGP